MGPEIVTVAFVAAVVVITAVIYLIMRPKGEINGTEAFPEQDFHLEGSPADGRSYKLWLKYDINWAGTEHEFGLTFDLDVQVDGESRFRGQLRTGSKAVTETDRLRMKESLLAGERRLPEGVISPTRVRCSKGRRGGIYFEKATIAVAETGSRGPGSRISVTGKLTPAENTSVNSLYFFLAR